MINRGGVALAAGLALAGAACGHPEKGVVDQYFNAVNQKDTLEKERRSVARSLGDVEDVESLKGDVTDKQIEVDLTLGGQVQPYVMTLRKYDLKRDNGQRVMSRWVIQNLQPKS